MWLIAMTHPVMVDILSSLLDSFHTRKKQHLASRINGIRVEFNHHHCQWAVVETGNTWPELKSSSQEIIRVQEVNNNCAWLASVAFNAAWTGDSDQFQRFSQTKRRSARRKVSRRPAAIAEECAQSTMLTAFHCSDFYDHVNQIIWQSLWIQRSPTGLCSESFPWSLSLISNQCHECDQPTLMIHEKSHVN